MTSEPNRTERPRQPASSAQSERRTPLDPTEEIAALVLSVPGVADLHGGRFGEVATYLPGRRVRGVTLTERSCAVHIVVIYPGNIVDIADRVRHAVTPVIARPVDVTVEDLHVEDVQRDRTAP